MRLETAPAVACVIQKVLVEYVHSVEEQCYVLVSLTELTRPPAAEVRPSSCAAAREEDAASVMVDEKRILD